MGEMEFDKLHESFAKMKKDIEENALRISELEKENHHLREQLHLGNTDHLKKTIKDSVKEAFESINRPRLEKEMQNRLNRNKKNILRHKILDLIASRDMTIGELKDYMVDEAHYCSKATFYRYISHLQKKNLIEIIEVDDRKIVALSHAIKMK